MERNAPNLLKNRDSGSSHYWFWRFASAVFTSNSQGSKPQPNHWWLERCICKASLLLIQIPFFPGHHILSKPFTFPIQYLLRRTAVTEFCWYRNPHRSGSSPEIVLHQVHTTEADDFPDWLVQQSFKLNLATVISTLIFLAQVLDISEGCQELGKSR